MLSTRSSLLIRLRDPADGVGWEEFASVYYPFLYEVALRAGIPQDDAKDVIQDLFLVLLKVLPNFEYEAERGKFRSWLKRVVRNRVIDWYRRKQRDPVRLQELSWLSEETNDFDEQHRMHLVRHVLDEVRRASVLQTWLCFERHVLKGQSAERVAADLQVSTNAVYVNSSRTLSKIRQKCATYGGEF
ncbi:MAG: sigma-70 family RNA polymerase sigma factor [Planctomycetaceae bacterium]|nr:sigma-70 family RNA polymerase sigma factor [Planctomycetaceae bacterium]